jgi:hypothetical protein
MEDEPAALVLEVSDHHPARVVRNEADGVTERVGTPEYGRGLHLRTGPGARGLRGPECAGGAERIRRAVYEFAQTPPEDDLALLVLQAQ